VNWIKWALEGESLSPELAQSLADQTRWLAARLELHLLGNHLFANAKALVFAGVYFDGAEADGWLATGLTILAREIPEQILADGGQFERSPMYHALAVEDMLDLCNVTTAYPEAIPARWTGLLDSWPETLAGMRRWMLAMRHPDGEIGFFNDAAMGIAPAAAALESYADRLGLGAAPPLGMPVTPLAASGYVRVQGEHAVALLDVAPVGPNYLPGHGHADTLSFELSLFGQRVLVNSGTSQYGAGAERLRQRGTAAHNTVVVDDADSSEVWGGFRVARRARPIDFRLTQGQEVAVRCSHDGYRRLAGHPTHTREWRFRSTGLTVEDHLGGRFARAEARFHLHPSVTIDGDDADSARDGVLRLRLHGGQRVRVLVEQGSIRIEPSTWHPEFGRTVANLCVVVRLLQAVSRIHLDWSEVA
jgi:uncharacterized heparinase superfamily protein